MKTLRSCLHAAAVATGFLVLAAPGQAAGTLTPVGSPDAPIQIRDHQVAVVINNGFARTEVQQSFFNPNGHDLEAVYVFPVPKSASLSEVTIWAGERELNGEVLPRSEAEQVYAEEKASGNDAGLASQQGYQNFEFRVHPVRAQSETRMRIVYYQPLPIDTGVGRYVYPLEDGGTDEAGASFWTANSQVQGRLSITVELKSAVPVADVRVPGFETAATVEKIDAGHFRMRLDRDNAALDEDFVFYYRLEESQPGSIELIAHRANRDEPGTFMMIVTPGVDLQPLTLGADYVYVLDVSGSMQGKLSTLTRGVSRALGEMKAGDRFRVVAFSDRAQEVIPWTPATPENVQHAIATVSGLRPEGSTNLYDGIAEALRQLDTDRATSLVLVTDGVTNTGVVDSKAFATLLRRQDLRFFGFLLGNNANWPLMQVAAEASGGFYAGVSNADDILGQILLAKSKITFEAMHDARLKITGIRVTDTTGDYPGKLYRGQQLVVFGRYEAAGPARVALTARITGEDKVYATDFTFPEIATDHPEIERLWAMSMIEQVQTARDMGEIVANEADQVVRDLGVTYSIVNEQTSMVVLTDDRFIQRGIERRNQQRVAAERQAQAARAQQPAQSQRIDAQQPAFSQPAPRLTRGGSGGGGGGALDPLTVLILAPSLLLACRLRRKIPG